MPGIIFLFCFVEKIVCQLATIVRQKCAQNIGYVDVRHLSLKFDQSLNCNLIRGSGLHPRTETECKVTFHLSAKPKLLKLGLSCPSTGLEKWVEHLDDLAYFGHIQEPNLICFTHSKVFFN